MVSAIFDEHALNVDLIRPSVGIEPIAALRVLFGEYGKAHINGDTADVVAGDVLCRHLPNGNIDHHRVVNVTHYVGGSLANMELRIEPCQPPRAPASAVGGYDLTDTWTSRDLPVLRAILHLHEADPAAPDVMPEGVVSLTGLDAGSVETAIRALESDGLIRGVRRGAAGTVWIVEGVSGEGRRRAGAWPNADVATRRLIEVLTAMADDTSRPEPERAGARRILDVVSAVGTSLLTAALARAMGLG